MDAFDLRLSGQEIDDSLLAAKVSGAKLAARRDPHALPGFSEIDHSLSPRHGDWIWASQNILFVRVRLLVKRVRAVTFDKMSAVHVECINEILCPHLEPG